MQASLRLPGRCGGGRNRRARSAFRVIVTGSGSLLITNLGYEVGPINQVDTYDDGAFTYATFEVAVTVPAPQGLTASDCFTITYEGESVNPCVDVTKPAVEICSVENDFVTACAHKTTGILRLVSSEAACLPQENRLELALPIKSVAAASRSVAAAPRER